MSSVQALIVTADEFGLSEDGCRRIARAHDHRVVTSATLRVDGPALQSAVRYAHRRPALAVGLVYAPGAGGGGAGDAAADLQRQLAAFDRTGLPLAFLASADPRAVGPVRDAARARGVPCRHGGSGVAGPDRLLPVGRSGGGSVVRELVRLEDEVTELIWRPDEGGTHVGLDSPFWGRLFRNTRIRLMSYRDVPLLAQGAVRPDARGLPIAAAGGGGAEDAPAEAPDAPAPAPAPGQIYDEGFNAGYDRGFDAGYDQGRDTGLRPRWDLFRETPIDIPELAGVRAIAVVPVRNEEKTLGVLLRQLSRLPLARIVVVVNGSADGSGAVARAAGCHVVSYPMPLGHDVARVAGVVNQDADIYLFTDADMPFEAEEFVPFLRAAATGVDVALNDITPFLTLESRLHVVSVAKDFLNRTLGRQDLGVNSLTAVPHALTRRAVRAIGAERLAVPPLAHAAAVLERLVIRPVHSVDVLSQNRIHAAVSPDRSPLVLEELILGDHVEALELIVQRLGRRGGLTDLNRRRGVLRGMGGGRS